jgi:hypothetical protein
VSKIICESPCFDGWLGPPAAAKGIGIRLAALAAADAARTLRRVGDDKFVDMARAYPANAESDDYRAVISTPSPARDIVQTDAIFRQPYCLSPP